MNINKLFLTLLVSAPLVLTACGGGSSGGSSDEDPGNAGQVGAYNGATTQATITDGNKEELAEAGVIGSRQAVSNNGLPTGARLETVDTRAADQLILNTIKLMTTATGSAVDASGACDSGSATVTPDGNTFNINYNQCETGGVIINGNAVLTLNDDGSSVIVYRNFTMTYQGETQTLNATVTCDSESSCQVVSSFRADNGRDYRVDTSSVSGNGFSGYNVRARVYDAEHGYIDVVASAVKFDCDNGNPSSGSISITAGNETARLDFDSCSSFTLTIGGVAETINW